MLAKVKYNHILNNEMHHPNVINDLAPFQLVTFKLNHIIYQRGQTIKTVYFPISGMISLLSQTHDGNAIETGIIGPDGVIGGNVTLHDRSFNQVTVQLPGQALSVPASRFTTAYRKHQSLHDIVDCHKTTLLIQAQQNAACHALHSVNSRLCRWLLQISDIIKSNNFYLTQQLLSHMLGVQRVTVSNEARNLAKTGLIEYSRGKIKIINHDGLEKCACECYQIIKTETAYLMQKNGKNGKHNKPL